MIKKVTQIDLGSICYLLEPSEVPYSTNKELVEDFNVSAVIWSGSSVADTTSNFDDMVKEVNKLTFIGCSTYFLHSSL